MRATHSAPWHRDIDTRLGPAIPVPKGDRQDKVLVEGKGNQVCTGAPPLGHAIIMAKNVLHAVPHRKNRKSTRIALVIWF